MQYLRTKLSQNTISLLFSNTGSAILSFLLFVFIGRSLGEAQLGIYVTVMAWIFPLSLLTEFGLGTLMTRDIAQDHNVTAEYLTSVTATRLIIGGTLIILMLLISPILSDDSAIVIGLQITSPLIIILPLYSAFTAIFRAYQVMRPIALLNLGMLISQVVLTAIYLTFSHEIVGIFIINLLTSVGQLIAAWFVYHIQFHTPNRQVIQIQKITSLLRAGTPFAIAAILATLNTRLNIILLDQLANSQEVGYYAVATRFIEVGRMIPHAFFDALFPLIASLITKPERLEILFRRVLWVLFGFGFLFTAILYLFAPTIVLYIFGESFRQSAQSVQILVLGFIPMILRQSRVLYWYAHKRETAVNWVFLGGLCLQLLMGLVLIPNLGAIGAGLSFIISEIIMLLMLFIPRRRY